MKTVEKIACLCIVGTLAGSIALAECPAGKSGCNFVINRSYFTGGGSLYNTDAINSMISANGYHGLRKYAYTIGGGFGWQAGRIINSLELQGVAWREQKLNTLLSNMYGVSGRIHTGVNVLPQGPLMLYPAIGFGTGRVRLGLSADEADFGQLLAGEVQKVDIKQRIVVVAAGLGFDYVAPASAGRLRAVLLGLRAGYEWDVSRKADWWSDDVTITAGPKFRASGPYVRLTIGRVWKARGQGGTEAKAAQGDVM